MSAHHCRLKDLRFQIKCADGNVPEAFRGNWFEASIGPSVETRIKRVVCAHWMSTVDSDIGEKAGKRRSVCLKSGDDPLRALTEAPQRGHSPVLLTWWCHTMGPQSGILKGQLCSVSFLRGTRAPAPPPAAVLFTDRQFSCHCTRGTQAPHLTGD